MLSDPILQWVLTVAFFLTAMYSALRLIRDRPLILMISNALHLVMSLAMISMCWPWWAMIPTLPQLVVFTSGTAWFAAVTVLQTQHRVFRASLAGHSAWHQPSHSVMMLAMVWMILAMPSDAKEAAQPHQHGNLEPWAALTGVAMTAALMTSGVLFLVELVRCLRGSTDWLGRGGNLASGALMSLGMAAMCWSMITG